MTTVEVPTVLRRCSMNYFFGDKLTSVHVW
jgi:hypothetical protein